MILKLSAIIMFILFLTPEVSSQPLNDSNVKQQTLFLDSIQEEIEGADIADNEEVTQEEIDLFVNNVKSARAALDLIKTERKKGVLVNEDELQKLIAEYNRKMKELKKSYKFIMFKSRGKHVENVTFSRAPVVSAIESLNCRKKRKFIKKEAEFEPLELVRVPDSSITVQHMSKVSGKSRITEHEE